MKRYKYVGPIELLKLLKTVGPGNKVLSKDDVIDWIEETNQELDNYNQVIATFVVSLDGHLLIADRHSEHVVCAGGEEVLSAGEITIEVNGPNVKVIELTNQSTGYCPEPESWSGVKTALENAKLNCPAQFAREFIFRRCEKCGLLNIVKENWFVCVACDGELSEMWNINQPNSTDRS